MDDVVVARIGKAHGLKGEVTVRVHTDSPQERFKVGASFHTDPRSSGSLTLRSARMHNGIQLLAFEGFVDRTAAESLRGVELLAQPDDGDEDDAWYEDDLLGFRVQLADGVLVGTVKGLEFREVQDLLIVEAVAGYDILLPFVEEIVPEIDEDERTITITPPPGLLELAKPEVVESEPSASRKPN